MAGRERFAEINARKVDVFNRAKIPQFTPKTIDKLEKRDILVYKLTGRPIKEIASMPLYKKKFWRTQDEAYEELKIPAKPLQVAIDPHNPIIKYSNNFSLERQKTFIEKYADRQNITGVKAIMPEASHVVELSLLHLQATGEYLLGKEQGYVFARTVTKTGKTPAGEDLYATVGCNSEALGMRVCKNPSYEHPNIVALPLLVPA